MVMFNVSKHALLQGAAAWLVCGSVMAQGTAEPPVPPQPAPAPSAPAPAPAAPAAAAPAAAAEAAPAASATAAGTVGATLTTGDAPLSDIESGTEPEGGEVEELPWALAHRRYNTLSGATGGIHVVGPSSGAPGSVRLQIALDSYSGSDFLLEDDTVEQQGQSISLSWTPTEYLELYGSLFNRGSATSESDESLHVLGDMLFGVELFASPVKLLRLGGGLRFGLLNAMGTSDTVLNATSIGLRGTAALDFQMLDHPLPFVARLNLDYVFDNSANVVEELEQDRYDALPDAADEADETRHLLTRFERFALGINRVDMFNISTGFEFPLELGEDVYLHPIAEWQLGVPVNRQDFDCAFFSSNKQRGTPKSLDDNCMQDEGFKSWPMTITLAARFVPPVRGLSGFLAVDLGIKGTTRFVRELVPNAPFRVLFGLGYDYDAEPPPPPPPPPAPVVAPEVAPEPEPIVGRVQGVVTAIGSGVPVSGARVAFPDHPVTALSTGEAGRFISYEFPPGNIVMDVSHPDYESGQCTGVIPETGGDVEVRCEVAPLPQTGNLEGRVTDAWGMGVAGARVQLSGPASATLITDEQGRFQRPELPPGAYLLRVDSSTHMIRTAEVNVTARATTTTTITAPERPSKPNVEVRGSAIRADGLTFEGDSTDLSSAGAQILAELADLLLRRPELRIRLQAPGSASLALTRSLLLKQELTHAGVDESRVEAVGGGGRKLVIAIVSP